MDLGKECISLKDLKICKIRFQFFEFYHLKNSELEKIF